MVSLIEKHPSALRAAAAANECCCCQSNSAKGSQTLLGGLLVRPTGLYLCRWMTLVQPATGKLFDWCLVLLNRSCWPPFCSLRKDSEAKDLLHDTTQLHFVEAIIEKFIITAAQMSFCEIQTSPLLQAVALLPIRGLKFIKWQVFCRQLYLKCHCFLQNIRC